MPETIRGSAMLRELVSEGLRRGATKDQIRDLIADGAIQEQLASRQQSVADQTGENNNTALDVKKVGRHEVTNKPATVFSDPATGKINGLEVIGNTLSGTVRVKFDNIRRLPISKERILRAMVLLNQKTSDGYSINLNIVEDNLVNWIKNPFSQVIKVNIVKDMGATRSPGAGALYQETRYFGVGIVMPPNAPRHWIAHEFGHHLGIGHSGYEKSVMFPASSDKSVNQFRMYSQEVKNLVDAYRRNK